MNCDWDDSRETQALQVCTASIITRSSYSSCSWEFCHYLCRRLLSHDPESFLRLNDHRSSLAQPETHPGLPSIFKNLSGPPDQGVGIVGIGGSNHQCREAQRLVRKFRNCKSDSIYTITVNLQRRWWSFRMLTGADLRGQFIRIIKSGYFLILTTFCPDWHPEICIFCLGLDFTFSAIAGGPTQLSYKLGVVAMPFTRSSHALLSARSSILIIGPSLALARCANNIITGLTYRKIWTIVLIIMLLWMEPFKPQKCLSNRF